MLPSEIPKLPTDPLVRGFPGVWKLLLFTTPSPGWESIPNSFVSLFTFIFCPAAAAAAKSLQSCPTLCNPMDFSLPDSSIHGIFQARVLEWVAIAFSNILSYFLWKITAWFSECSDVLCQRSEVVLWNLLSVQMFFRWICGGDSGLPVLFLHHLRITLYSDLRLRHWGGINTAFWKVCHSVKDHKNMLCWLTLDRFSRWAQ